MSQSVKNPSPPVTPCPQVKAAGIAGPTINQQYPWASAQQGIRV